MKAIALIPAAGMGRRMGATVNKQYLSLAGRPILAHTLALFEHHPRIDRILVVAPSDETDYCRREVVQRYRLTKVTKVIAGGAERQHSVCNGLKACEANDDDIILVHDGVRPLFPADLIDSVIDTAGRVGGCVVGMPVKDTVKTVENGRISGTPEREKLWMAQTPQAFPAHILAEAHRRATAEGFLGTDDASLVERIGSPVAMIEGSYRNIKITTPEDLLLADSFMKQGEER